jgi:hypothetical protein
MLISFSSKAGADILMLGEHAKPLLILAGKTIDNAIPERGIFTVEQLPQAIEWIEKAISSESAPPPLSEDEDDNDRSQNAISAPVGLRQRAFPLLDLMRKALQHHHPVTWEAGSGW